MMEKWQSLAPRERQLLTALSIVAVFAVLILGLIMPLQNSTKTRLDAIDRVRAETQEMQVSAAKFANHDQQASSADTANAAFVQIDQALKKSGLKASQISPDGDDTVRLRFDAVAFDPLITLLDSVQRRYGLVTTSATIDKLKSGEVKAQLELAR